MDGSVGDNMDYHKQAWSEVFKHHQLYLEYDTFDEKYHKGSLVEIANDPLWYFSSKVSYSKSS